MNEFVLAALVFAGAMLSTLIITPLVKRWAATKKVFDYPSARRVHRELIPRAGGIALFIGFLIAYISALAYASDVLGLALFDRRQLFFLIGALLVFLLGLADDIRQVSVWTKLFSQVGIALIVWFGGFHVERLSITLHEGLVLSSWISLALTVLWVVLLINAINIIDGLDGLAAGICLFVAITLLSMCIQKDDLVLLIGFSSLAGACLGFLRYNFNPATIFMGDCGSYLLGYILAALTIQGAMKSHATVALLIPIVALGVPLLDTLLAPVRRFFYGQKMFRPDRSHIHHRLLNLGYSHRRVVLLIYGMTILLGAIALLLVFFKDPRAAYILVLPGVLFFLTIKKLGYLEYIAADKVFGWLRDLTDEAGLTHERRSFINIQMRIAGSGSVDELWEHICTALKKLDFDMAEFHLQPGYFPGIDKTARVWQLQPGERKYDPTGGCQFKLEMPLLGVSSRNYGILWLVKDLGRSDMSHYTLRRVEHLRRAIISVLDTLS